MRRLSEQDLHILGVVAERERVCLGDIDGENGAFIAGELRKLAKWKYLLEECTDDGAAYSLSPAGRERLDAAQD